MSRVTLRVATSMTATDSPRPIVTYSVLPSGASARPIGRGPRTVLATGSILMWSVAAFLATSMTVTSRPFSQLANAVLPSGVKTIPRGRGPVGMCASTFSLRCRRR